MKNDLSTLHPGNIDSQLDHEKKNWIEPQISTWESEQIELGGGGFADAGTKTYN